MSRPAGRSTWTFLTHHARVLLEIVRNPEARVRDIAAVIGITERAVHGIVNDLHEAGYLTRERVGRRNRYTIDPDQSLRHPAEADLPVRRLIDMFAGRDLHNPGGAAETTSPSSIGRAGPGSSEATPG